MFEHALCPYVCVYERNRDANIDIFESLVKYFVVGPFHMVVQLRTLSHITSIELAV